MKSAVAPAYLEHEEGVVCFDEPAFNAAHPVQGMLANAQAICLYQPVAQATPQGIKRTAAGVGVCNSAAGRAAVTRRICCEKARGATSLDIVKGQGRGPWVEAGARSLPPAASALHAGALHRGNALTQLNERVVTCSGSNESIGIINGYGRCYRVGATATLKAAGDGLTWLALALLCGGKRSMHAREFPEVC